MVQELNEKDNIKCQIDLTIIQLSFTNFKGEKLLLKLHLNFYSKRRFVF